MSLLNQISVWWSNEQSLTNSAFAVVLVFVIVTVCSLLMIAVRWTECSVREEAIGGRWSGPAATLLHNEDTHNQRDAEAHRERRTERHRPGMEGIGARPGDTTTYTPSFCDPCDPCDRRADNTTELERSRLLSVCVCVCACSGVCVGFFVFGCRGAPEPCNRRCLAACLRCFIRRCKLVRMYIIEDG